MSISINVSRRLSIYLSLYIYTSIYMTIRYSSDIGFTCPSHLRSRLASEGDTAPLSNRSRRATPPSVISPDGNSNRTYDKKR